MNLQECRHVLDSIKELPDNWDSEGALAINPERVEKVWLLLTCCPTMPRPWIELTDSAIYLDWELGTSSACVLVNSKGYRMRFIRDKKLGKTVHRYSCPDEIAERLVYFYDSIREGAV